MSFQILKTPVKATLCHLYFFNKIFVSLFFFKGGQVQLQLKNYSASTVLDLFIFIFIFLVSVLK